MPTSSPNKSSTSNATKVKSKSVKKSCISKTDQSTCTSSRVTAAPVSSVKGRKNYNDVPKGVKQKSVSVQTMVRSNSSKLNRNANVNANTLDVHPLKKVTCTFPHTRKVAIPKKKDKTKLFNNDETINSDQLIKKVETYNRVLSAMKNDFA